jgi:hypothetical protein
VGQVDSTVNTSRLIQDSDDEEGSRMMEVLFWFISNLQPKEISRAFGIIKPTRNRAGFAQGKMTKFKFLRKL